MGVGWGVWSWATIGANRVERGKGPTCVLFKGIMKMLGWGFTFMKGWGLIKGANGWCMIC